MRTSDRHEQHERAPRRARQSTRRAWPIRARSGGAGGSGCALAIRPSPGADSRCDPEQVQHGQGRGGGRGRHAAVGVQEHDEKADQARLRLNDERAGGRESPDPRVAKRRGCGGPVRVGLRHGPFAQHAWPRRPLRRRTQLRARAGPRRGSSWGESSGRPKAVRAPAIGTAVWRTPSASPRLAASNQCMTARPLAELTLAPRAPANASRTTSAGKRGDERRSRRRRPPRSRARTDHGPLAEAVGGATPRVERRDRRRCSERRARAPPPRGSARTAHAARGRAR